MEDSKLFVLFDSDSTELTLSTSVCAISVLNLAMHAYLIISRDITYTEIITCVNITMMNCTRESRRR